VTSRTVSGRIPIRLEPVRGESFDGWLDAYAQRLRVSTVDLANALGVPPAFRRFRGPKLALAQPAADPERIASRAGGIDPARIEALWIGLARYDRLLGQRLGTSILMRAARLLSWSRSCPSCLREGGGRWLAAWRLPWYLACPVHHTMLASSCACCGGAQRDGVLRAEYCEALTTACCRPTGDTTGRGDNRCRHDLTADTAPAPAPAPPELIALQAELVTILEPTVTERDADRLVDSLADL
jgi:hypothetical protein